MPPIAHESVVVACTARSRSMACANASCASSSLSTLSLAAVAFSHDIAGVWELSSSGVSNRFGR